jgi:8-oxo-dGTP diphosphatase
MEIPMEIKKTGVICFLQYEKSFLLLKRNKEPYKYLFASPRGTVESNETLPEAATRETLKQVGVTIQDWKYCGTMTEISPKSEDCIHHVYIAHVDHFPPPPSDDGMLEWMLFENLTNIPTPTTDWYIYKYIFKNQEFAFHATFDENQKLIEMKEVLEDKLVYEKK